MGNTKSRLGGQSNPKHGNPNKPIKQPKEHELYTCEFTRDQDDPLSLKCTHVSSQFGQHFVYFALPKQQVQKGIQCAKIVVCDIGKIPSTHDTTWIYPQSSNLERTVINGTEYENYKAFSQQGKAVTLRISRAKKGDLSRIVYETPYRSSLGSNYR